MILQTFKHPWQITPVIFVVYLILLLASARLHGQGIILACTGQDAGIDVMEPYTTVAVKWEQYVSFSDVTFTARLQALDSMETGWASVTLDGQQVASTSFTFPNGYSDLVLFTGLNLPEGIYAFTIGAFTGQDGWAVPAGASLIAANGVNYNTTVSTFGLSYPVDFSIISVPEPSSFALFGLSVLLVAVRRLLPSK